MGLFNRFRKDTGSTTPKPAARKSKTAILRHMQVEQLEERRLMAADVLLGAVYFEEATGDDSQPDVIQVSFEGGAEGTVLNRIVIDGDIDRNGQLSPGDIFFDTTTDAPGAFEAVGLTLISNEGFDVTSVSVSDGGSQLVFTFDGFDAGEELIFSVDADEGQVVNPDTGELVTNALVEGAEFQFTELIGEFSAPGFLDLTLSDRFVDFFDQDRIDAEQATGLELTQLPDDDFLSEDVLVAEPITSDDNFVDRTAGAVAHAPQVALATLSGFVYHDLDDDGIFDEGEDPIADVTIELLNDVGEVVATTTTNEEGFYEFTDLVAGTYGVRETQPVGFFDGQDTAGTVEGETRGVAANDLLTGVVLEFGDNSINNNFGELLGGSIAGLVHASEDGDCNFDDPEVLLAGVVIELLDANGQRIATTETDAQGRYRFDNLAPGEYQVRQIQPTDYNGRPLFDGDERAGSAGGDVANDLITGIRIGSGENAVNNDFCEHFGASLSGFVYHDESNDGVFDAGEDPIPGTTLRLLLADGTDTGRVAVTDETGFYEFTDLEPGSYTVVEEQPDGFFDGIDTPGTTTGDVSVNDVIAMITVGFGMNSEMNNFGELLPGSIAGRVHASLDGDCDFDDPDQLLEGVVIQLLNANGEVIDQTTTDANGEYRFDNLAPGSYGIREIQPEGFFDGDERAGTAGGVVSNDLIVGIDLGSGENAVNYDFCEHVGAELSGFVFHDESNDGVFDANEDPIEGVLVELIDTASGQVVATTTTGADGSYWFTGLNAGTYGVREVQPVDFLDGIDSLGTVGSETRGVASNDVLTEVTLDFGDRGVNYNFGELLGASLAGRVHAQNGPECDFDNPDVLLEGVVLQLLDREGNVVAQTTTDASGEYRFSGLRPGEYQVRQIQPTDFDGRALFDGSEQVGDAGGVAFDNPEGDLISGIVLGSGQDAVSYDFCEHFGATLSGFVYHDVDNDGVFDVGEDPIPGTTLRLLNEAGEEIRTFVTGADGFYEFTDLAPGTYTVSEYQPEGFLDGIDSPGSLGGDASVNDMIAQITLTFGDNSVNNNFGELLPGSIAGRVHASMNGDCDFDNPGQLLEGVVIQLINADGEVIDETTTDVNGEYRFDNLPPGSYGIREIQPVDFFNGEFRIGSGAGTNFGEDFIGAIFLGSGQDLVNYDFCEILPASLSGFVFVDGPPIVRFDTDPITPQEVANVRDGARTPDDQPIEGVLLELRDGVTGEIILGEDLLPGVYPNGPVTTLTGPNGFYEFLGLPAGVYAVIEAQPVGFIDGIDTFGSLGGVAINPTAASAQPQFFPTSTQESIAAFSAQFGSDAILLIELDFGQNSVENNFSEVTTQPPLIPPMPPVVTAAVTPVFVPPPQAFVPQALPPLVVAPPVDTPLFAGSSRSLGYTWHLSVVNAGQPRELAPTDAAARFVSAQLNGQAWRDAQLDRAEWKLIDDDQQTGEFSKFAFGTENGIPVAGDWNGDGITDIGVYVDGYWYLDLNGNGRWDKGDLWAHLGSEADLPVVGDWDNDGKDDIGIFGPAWPRDPHAIARDPGLPDAENSPTQIADEHDRPLAKNVPPTELDATSGGRDMRRTARGAGRTDRIDHVFHYGTPGDTPIAGDWNGDGIRTIGVFRDGVWTLDTDGDGRLTERDESFATIGGQPAVGDWNGDGIDEIGVFNAGQWLVDTNGDHQLDARDTAFELGAEGDTPIVGDWDGDGVDEPGAYGPRSEEVVRVSQKAG